MKPKKHVGNWSGILHLGVGIAFIVRIRPLTDGTLVINAPLEPT